MRTLASVVVERRREEDDAAGREQRRRRVAATSAYSVSPRTTVPEPGRTVRGALRDRVVHDVARVDAVRVLDRPAKLGVPRHAGRGPELVDDDAGVGPRRRPSPGSRDQDSRLGLRHELHDFRQSVFELAQLGVHERLPERRDDDEVDEHEREDDDAGERQAQLRPDALNGFIARGTGIRHRERCG